MRVVTSNIKCNPEMRQEHVISDIVRIRDTWGANVYFGQEIEIDRYKNAWRTIFRELGYKVEDLAIENPQAVLIDGWTFLGRETRQAHGGRGHVTPARWISVTKWKRQDGQLVAFMGVHYVSGAWSSKHLGTRLWRRHRWNQNYRKQRAWILELKGQGFTVVSGGDYNRVDPPQFTDPQVTVAHHGIDRIDVHPAAGVTVEKLGEYLLTGLHTDHAAVMAHFSLHHLHS